MHLILKFDLNCKILGLNTFIISSHPSSKHTNITKLLSKLTARKKTWKDGEREESKQWLF